MQYVYKSNILIEGIISPATDFSATWNKACVLIVVDKLTSLLT